MPLTARVANASVGEYRPLVNVIGLWMLEQTLKDFASRPKSDADWAKLIKQASALGAKRSAPSVVLDMIFAEFGNPPSMKTAIDAQLKRRKLPLPKNLAGYVRLICDSLGAGHALAIRDFEKLSGRTFKRILMVGGGSKNRLLCQATANASGLAVHSFALEGSTVGNLANQLIALKAVKNLAAFRAALAPHSQTNDLPATELAFNPRQFGHKKRKNHKTIPCFFLVFLVFFVANPFCAFCAFVAELLLS
ncbi:MAG: FGGY-family carbohydrate kinase [Lacunisphaera sp.]